ncbi:MAG TPA: hypothetical protein VGB84_10115 [Arachidicoccus sp.]
MTGDADWMSNGELGMSRNILLEHRHQMGHPVIAASNRNTDLGASKGKVDNGGDVSEIYKIIGYPNKFDVRRLGVGELWG